MIDDDDFDFLDDKILGNDDEYPTGQNLDDDQEEGDE